MARRVENFGNTGLTHTAQKIPLPSPMSEKSEFKRLYYETDLKVKSVEVGENNAKIVFEDSDDSIELVGDSTEFLELASHLVKTVRGGEEVYIDVSDVPAGDVETFERTVEKFQVDGTEPVDRAMERINNQKSDLPESLDYRVAFDAALECDFGNEYLKGIIENYIDAAVLLKYRREDLKRTFQNSFEGRIDFDSDRFTSYKSEFDQMFEESLYQYPPLEMYRIYRQEIVTDMEFLLERIMSFGEFENKEWRALVQADEPLEPDLTIEKVLRAYAKRYEILRDVLRDYAYLLTEENEPDLNSMRNVVRLLKSEGYWFIDEALVHDFRNGITHESIEVQKDMLYVYGSRNKEDIKRTLDIHEVVEHFNKLRELLTALMFSYLVKEEELFYDLLRSDTFKYHIAENYSPSS